MCITMKLKVSGILTVVVLGVLFSSVYFFFSVKNLKIPLEQDENQNERNGAKNVKIQPKGEKTTSMWVAENKGHSGYKILKAQPKGERKITITLDEQQNERHRTYNARLRAEADKVTKAMPPEPKGCPTAKGLIPDENTISSLSIEMVNYFYHAYSTNIEIVCHHMVRMGVLGDGGWEVCDDEYVRPKQDCLVYSFGINFDFSFDDMSAKHYGCEVHSFDPSMGVSSTKRSQNVTFHNLGVYGSNARNKGWSYQTLKQIRQTLQHTERTIDVLKMDVESSEWSTLTTAVADDSLNNVRQFLVELHNTADTRSSLKILKRLRNLGFRIFYAHKNAVCDKGVDVTPLRTFCHELQMIHLPSCVVK